MHRLGLQSAVVAYVAIDNVPIDIDSDEDPQSEVGANIGPLETVEKETFNLPRVVAIGIYVGAILLIPLSALLVLCYARRTRRQAEEKASYWKRDNKASSETSQSEDTPRQSRQHDEEASLSGQDSSHRYQCSVQRSLESADVSISGSNEREDSDTSALVARGTFR